MTDITLSSAVRSNLLNLQNTADLLGKTQERLATGKKVNSALDNPTNFFTASSLNSRASDLSRLLDSVSNATQTLEAADNGISAITNLVESAQASARQALQAPGQVTESKVEGGSGATFNPEALASVAGDNTATFVGGLTADASASIGFADYAADLANIADIATADLSGSNSSATALDSLTAPLVDGDSINFNVNGVDYTLNITDDGATGAARGGNATDGFTIDLDQDATIADTDDVLNTLLSGSGVSVADDGDGSITVSFSSDVDTVVLSDGAGDGSSLTALGLNAVGTDNTSTGGDTGDRLLARNADFEAFLAANGSQSVDVALGAAAPTTLTFGTGASEISTKSELVDALNALSGVSATDGGANTDITVTTSDSNDASSALTFTSSDTATQTFLNFDVAADDGGIDLDTQAGLVTTSSAQNLLTQSAVSQGDTLDIQIGNSTQLSLTFGTGTGQIQSIAELNSALEDLAGGAASVDARGEINVTADNAGDSISVGGSSTARAAFGLQDSDVGNLFNGEASSLVDGTNITEGDTLTIQVGTNNALDITFGTGNGQVNTVAELEDALGNLAGGKASIDDTTGAITVEATVGSESITISSTDAADASKDAVAASFGLTQGTTTSVTTDSETRSELRGQYNELLVQIDELAEDAGFNGVNLLAGDDLKVIFNEDGSSTLDIDGVNFDSSSLGISRLNSGYFQSDTNIEATLDTLDTVINTLRSQASKFGSNLSVVETRQDFTKNTINTLETGAANLTLADTNEEGANLLALQTRQSLSTTALSLSSQADQNVLRLF